jgi:hypothetical protein
MIKEAPASVRCVAAAGPSRRQAGASSSGAARVCWFRRVWYAKLLIYLAVRGSLLGAYSHLWIFSAGDRL